MKADDIYRAIVDKSGIIGIPWVVKLLDKCRFKRKKTHSPEACVLKIWYIQRIINEKMMIIISNKGEVDILRLASELNQDRSG